MTTIFECSWKNGEQRSEHETADGAKSKARRLSKGGADDVVVFEYHGQKIFAGWTFFEGKQTAALDVEGANDLDARRVPQSQVDEETGVDASAPPVAEEAAPKRRGKKAPAEGAEPAPAKARGKKAPAEPKPEAPAMPKGVVGEVLTAFKARLGTNRAALLTAMAQKIGKPVSVADLATAVYGDAEKERLGPLSMVMKGAQYSIGKEGLTYAIEKTKNDKGIFFTLSRGE